MIFTEDQLIPFHSTDLTGKRVLVLAPHPDDETIGCGGALALHSAAGDPVQVLILTNGAKGDVSRRFDRNAYIALRQQETRSACASLGISDVTFWPYEDRELANAGTVVPDLVSLIKTCQPDLIYAPSPLEFHPDHRAAADFIQTAVKLCRTDADLLFYEVGQPLKVDILVDITGVVDKKMQALHQYRSQLQERPYDDVALALNRFRSLTLPKEVTHAEGFIRYQPTGLNTGIGNWTEWSGKPVAESLNDCPGYAIAVIVRTQGIRQPLLKEALSSISGQSNPCLAVVVVHAGAEMLKMVESVCREIPSLSWVLIHADRIENKRGYPLNIGLQYACTCHSDSEAVAFLDDDDILYPDFSARMIQTMRETGADVICAASNRSAPGQAVEEGYRPVSFLNLFVLNFVPINSYIIRLASLAKTPVFFDETLDVVEDWHYLLQLLQNGFRFEAIMDILSEFRIISDGNKPIKDNPEMWEQAHNRIYTYIRDSLFLMNGQMIHRLMADERLKDADHQQSLTAMQKCMDDQIHQKDMNLQDADEKIVFLEQVVAEKERVLQEIFASKGWRWLTRYRNIKQGLVILTKRYSQ